MKLTRVLAIGVIAGSIGIGASQAQIREQQPAEFPPASYKGKQYVDSKGCVFVRAGIDGNVSWIPRVSRDRKTICGFQPSLAGAGAAAPTPAPAPAKPPVQITVDQTPAQPVAPAAAPAPAPRVTAQAPRPAPAPAPRVVRKKPKPQPAPVVRQPVAVAAAPIPTPQVQPQTRRVATACPRASALGQRYLPDTGVAVRCGPQQERIVAGDYTPRAGVREQGTVVTSQTRIVPKHVAIKRQNTRNVTVPQGYEPAWTDDRLNPHRAEQNLTGRRDMLLIWTNTLPRRLVDRRTGRDMTASIPLVYPYLDLAEQSREIGKVTIVKRDGKVVKRIKRNAVPVTTSPRTPVYSTRSAPKVEAPKPKVRAVPAGARVVQVGTFGNPANAQRMAQRVANMGLPARIGKVRRNGKTYMVVQSGPFADGQNTARALQKLRRAGFSDAFARK
ncbi:SPOR domain-containing protein [uncultured Sulfitobacter sp.]|uniref:SPOR domain-containing protein n=1 Tax=uncultured Sulfitobacter sp. TaxID=191468 RepID=UPI00262BAFAC|nr:SPOR domain-containing protein [uncultured Sulfitobacter sp.]